jgi:predicted anti-sigma-YlaC factor YlaD
MNCQEFQDRLYDYVDDTLGSDVQARVREHLRSCGDCRRALLCERAVAQSISHSLNRATGNLSARPEMLRNVLEAWESRPILSNGWMRAWRWFISNPVQPVSAGAALLAALVLFVGLSAVHQHAADSVSQGVAKPPQITWIIDVPIQTQTHLSRLQNGVVIDAIALGVAIDHARFFQTKTSANSL